jgi:hypothetical protein
LKYGLTAGEYAALGDVEARDHFGFGGGRRICPGLHIAERSVFINLARLLWGFNIEHAKDEHGNIIPVDASSDGMLPGAMSNPKYFECCRSLSFERTDQISYHSSQPEEGENHEGRVGAGPKTRGGFRRHSVREDLTKHDSYL